MSKLKNIMISGYYGFGNCGDEAILLALTQELSKHISKEKIIVLSNNPENTEKIYKVKSINRFNLISIISKLKDSSLFISGGGGLLQDVSGKGLSILYYLGLIFMARLFKIPTIVYGQGIGPIKKNINKALVKIILKKVDLIIVRDEESKALLKKMGIINKKIIVNADTAFLLEQKEIHDDLKKKYGLENVIDENDKYVRSPRIGIIIRNCDDIEKDYDNKIMQFVKITDHLIEQYQAIIYFIPFQPGKDISIIKDIISRMKSTEAKIIEEELSPDEILYLISRLSIIIGMRLHSIIFSTMTNKPFIAIEYDPKVKYYVNSLNLIKLMININQLTVKNIDNKLKYINVNQEMIRTALSAKKEQFEQEALSNSQLLYQFINKNCVRKDLENS